jgi:hypothetical protein
MVGQYRRLAMKMTLDPVLALEAKALTALAFRNGPIENLHAGKSCAACAGKQEYSHISDEEIKGIMKAAVNTMFRLLWQRANDPTAYAESLEFGRRSTLSWDEPELKAPSRRGRPPFS